MALAPLGVLCGIIPLMVLHITLLGNLKCNGPFLGLVNVLFLIKSLNFNLFLNNDPDTLTSSVLTNTTHYPESNSLAT